MTLAELVQSRRTIKTFKPDVVSRELIFELIDLAVFAPNHRFTEPWRFILLSDEAKKQYAHLRAEDARARGKNYEQARLGIEAIPNILIVTSSRSDNRELDLENYAATSCMMQNFLLLAWEKGIGSSWKTFADVPSLRQFLGLEEEHVLGVLYLGYPVDLPPTRRHKTAAELVRVL
jgi:nitroreductase